MVALADQDPGGPTMSVILDVSKSVKGAEVAVCWGTVKTPSERLMTKLEER